MLFSEFSTKIFAYLLSLIYFCIINDNFTSMQISDIVMTESYMETLKCHPKDRTKVYPLPKAVSYNGFHNAKTRLKKMGMDFIFTRIDDNGVEYLKVKRTK